MSTPDRTAPVPSPDPVVRPSARPTPASTQPVPSVTPAAAPDEPRPRIGRREQVDVLDRQKERFGGVRWGSAFFGWLTAIGTAVLLTALITGIAGAIGLAAVGSVGQVADQAGQVAANPGAAQTTGIVSAVVAAAVLFVAYYCGGYVAGRMARFNGMKQGAAVWIWTIVITIVVAILAATAGDRFDVLGAIGGLPQLPISGQAVGAAAVIAAVVALAVSFIGAVLGGLAGMRFHRRIDRADLSDDPAVQLSSGDYAG